MIVYSTAYHNGKKLLLRPKFNFKSHDSVPCFAYDIGYVEALNLEPSCIINIAALVNRPEREAASPPVYAHLASA